MHVKAIRNSILFSAILLFVFSARSPLANGLFAIGIGLWIMSATFKIMFKSVLDSKYFTWDKYIFHPRDVLFDLLFSSTRKQTILIIVWWLLGISIAIATYKILSVLLISS